MADETADTTSITPNDSYLWFVDQIENAKEHTALELLASCHIGIQLYFLAGQLQVMNQLIYNLGTEANDDSADGDPQS
jgi:hypothetical protein